MSLDVNVESNLSKNDVYSKVQSLDAYRKKQGGMAELDCLVKEVASRYNSLPVAEAEVEVEAEVAAEVEVGSYLKRRSIEAKESKAFKQFSNAFEGELSLRRLECRETVTRNDIESEEISSFLAELQAGESLNRNSIGVEASKERHQVLKDFKDRMSLIDLGSNETVSRDSIESEETLDFSCVDIVNSYMCKRLSNLSSLVREVDANSSLKLAAAEVGSYLQGNSIEGEAFKELHQILKDFEEQRPSIVSDKTPDSNPQATLLDKPKTNSVANNRTVRALTGTVVGAALVVLGAFAFQRFRKNS